MAKISILSIAPYKIIPPSSGGQLAITKLHHYIGGLCKDIIVSTETNADQQYNFQLYKVFPDKPNRYFPGFGLNKIIKIAEEHNVTHIICEHPYMSFTAIALAEKLHVPWFMRSHNIESERFRALGKKWWPILRRYERYAMRKADGILFITEEDAVWAAEHFSIEKGKCYTIPFGTDKQAVPVKDHSIKTQLAETFSINPDVPWLYFLGALDYQPNEEAVQYIIHEVMPKLSDTNYEVLIAGRGLSETLQNTISNTERIQYVGFVPDLNDFLLACDIMLNPVMKGGGIKTKAVEALGYNNTVISSESGAAGLTRAVCGEKLMVTTDHDWGAFANAILKAMNQDIDTPTAFYKEYYHGNVAQNVLDILAASTR